MLPNCGRREELKVTVLLEVMPEERNPEIPKGDLDECAQPALDLRESP